MASPHFHRVSLAMSVFIVSLAAGTAGAASAPKTDASFVGKVSQGGSFEVQAGQLAVTKAASPAVKAFAEKDVADHEKVNAELKSIADAQGLTLVPVLNKPLQKKLDKLGKLSGPEFDKAYIHEMAKIHHKDEGIFAKEAKSGTGTDWKAFAGKTDEIVKGHITTLDEVQPGLK